MGARSVNRADFRLTHTIGPDTFQRAGQIVQKWSAGIPVNQRQHRMHTLWVTGQPGQPALGAIASATSKISTSSDV